jgi:hypothetical protein
MSLDTPSVRRSPQPAVRLQDRLFDIAALALLAGGVLLFAIGRQSLTRLADARYEAPPAGVSWVSRTDLHVSQTRWGAWLAGAGLILSVAAALRHGSRRRRLG